MRCSAGNTGRITSLCARTVRRLVPRRPWSFCGRRSETDWIARRIRNMIDSGEKIVWDKEAAIAGNQATRAVQPGDMALLFRALTNIEYYEEALRRYGIDYYLVGGHAFYAQQEIFDLLNLLRTLESSIDESSLAGGARSPFFNLLDETIFW